MELGWTSIDLNPGGVIADGHIKTASWYVNDKVIVPEEVRAEDGRLKVGQEERVTNLESSKREGERLPPESEDRSTVGSLKGRSWSSILLRGRCRKDGDICAAVHQEGAPLTATENRKSAVMW